MKTFPFSEAIKILLLMNVDFNLLLFDGSLQVFNMTTYYEILW